MRAGADLLRDEILAPVTEMEAATRGSVGPSNTGH
jgi:hypothetical protein